MSARTVVVTFTMQVDDDVTPDMLDHVAGAAEVQFSEPVLTNEDDGEPTHGVISGVRFQVSDPRAGAVLPFDAIMLEGSEESDNLQVRCDICRAHLCDAEPGDPLHVLVGIARDHACAGADQ